MITQIFSIIIIIIGSVATYISTKKKEKEDSLFYILFTAGIELINNASGDFLDKIITETAIIMGNNNLSSVTGEFNIWNFAFGIFLVIVAITIKISKKNKLCVLNINGYYKRNVEPYLKSKKTILYDYREREINFVHIYKRMFSIKKDEDSFKCILEQIKEETEAFKNETIELKRGYTGIAPIPFIMYAGTYLNRVEINKYYEFDKIDTNQYYELTNKNNYMYPELKLKTELDKLDTGKKEVVVEISITQKITDQALKQFKANSDICRLEIDNPKDNAIRSVKQLNNYTNIIFTIIEKITHIIPDIKRINIVCSSQSCLALEIGKRSVDSTRIPEIVAYQFESQSNIKYPWGIVINGTDKGKLIKVEEVEESNV